MALAEGDVIELEEMRLQVLETPGHTPISVMWWSKGPALIDDFPGLAELDTATFRARMADRDVLVLDACSYHAFGSQHIPDAWHLDLDAVLYPKLKAGILAKGDFGELTFPQLFKVNDWIVLIPVAALSLLLFYWLESVGL